MTLTVSPQIRLVALIGALAAAGLAVFMFTMGGAPSDSVDGAAVKTIKPLYGGKKVAVHPAKPATAAKHVAPVKPVRPAAHAKRTAQPAAKPKATPKLAAVTANGLPMVVATALETHPVVVVALYDPQARVDGISLAEARAGATAAQVGFVPLDVLDTRQAGPLTKLLGVLPDPAVLVYRRPGDLVARFDGFADRDTVAQAATNALPAGLAQQASATVRAVTRADWATKAEQICRANSATPSSLKPADLPRALAKTRAAVTALAALALPTDSADRLAAEKFVAAAKQTVAVDAKLVGAYTRHDSEALRRLKAPFLESVVRLDAAAAAAGAPACGARSS